MVFNQTYKFLVQLSIFYETVLENIIVFCEFSDLENASFVINYTFNVTYGLLLEFKGKSHYGDC